MGKQIKNNLFFSFEILHLCFSKGRLKQTHWEMEIIFFTKNIFIFLVYFHISDSKVIKNDTCVQE